MEEEIIKMLMLALAVAPMITGITEVFKAHTSIKGLGVIMTALVLSLGLFGAVALTFDYSLRLSLLTGFITGLASVGAYEGIEETIIALGDK